MKKANKKLGSKKALRKMESKETSVPTTVEKDTKRKAVMTHQLRSRL